MVKKATAILDRPPEWDGTPDPEPLDITIPKAMEPMSEEDCYLAAIFQDRSGVDLAEFCWVDETKDDSCYRLFPAQWAWWRDRSPRSIDQGGRSIGKCVAGNTLIQCADGRHRRIDTLVGTTPELASWEPELKIVIPVRAEAIYASGVKPVYRVETASGRDIRATADHRFLTQFGWAKLSQLWVGAQLITPDGDLEVHDEVTFIEEAGEEETYDISMAGEPNFIANGIVVHNSESIMAQACAFPFSFPGQEFVIIAPEGTHADAITDRIEMRIRASRLLTGMLVGGRSGIKHKPFVATFENGARVYTRLPQRSGLGCKGIHPAVLHVDEGQDVSDKAWAELPEVVRWEVEGACWKVHGVSKGIQGDAFYRMSQPGSGFTVHRITGLHKPTWSRKEREQKIKEYGGSAESPDFIRNVYGMHGNAMNRLFVLTRLFACVDTMDTSDYNTEEYCSVDISADALLSRVSQQTGSKAEIEASTEEQAAVLRQMCDFPASHRSKYQTFWSGMDVGAVSDPSEILVFAEYIPDKAERQRDSRKEIAVPDPGLSRFKLVTRIKLRMIPLPLQAQVIMWVIDQYRPKAFSLDRTGLGIGLLQELQKLAGSSRFLVTPEADDPVQAAAVKEKAGQALTAIKGYNFSEKVVLEIDESLVNDLGLSDAAEILDKAGVRQNAKDRATDVLRELVDTRRLLLPYDGDVINQMNGQTWAQSQEPLDKYGRRRSTYSLGTFHILDAARMFALGWSQEQIELMIASTRQPDAPVFAYFGE